MKYVTIDNFLPGQFADDLYRELRKIEVSEKWYRYDSPFERKRSTDNWDLFPKNTNHFLMTTLTGPFIKTVEKQLGMTGLVADGSLRGGGIHCQESGSFLHCHADFNMHPQLKLYRRANGILYMNKNWDSDWGGDLELWSEDMTVCEKKIAPKFNRLVLFEIHDKSFHGLPDPITCPPEQRRMSLAFYYYSPKRDGDADPHSTLFQRRPNDPIDDHTEELRRQRNLARLSSNV
jgi:Rps23 Pro-64 3,4-dihydroxylase Tpa1-like proline 4-hydroxylase